MSKFKCSKCGKKLEVAHVVEDETFCSKECAIAFLTDILINSAKDQATTWYNECVDTYKVYVKGE